MSGPYAFVMEILESRMLHDSVAAVANQGSNGQKVLLSVKEKEG